MKSKASRLSGQDFRSPGRRESLDQKLLFFARPPGVTRRDAGGRAQRGGRAGGKEPIFLILRANARGEGNAGRRSFPPDPTGAAQAGGAGGAGHEVPGVCSAPDTLLCKRRPAPARSTFIAPRCLVGGSRHALVLLCLQAFPGGSGVRFSFTLPSNSCFILLLRLGRGRIGE